MKLDSDLEELYSPEEVAAYFKTDVDTVLKIIRSCGIEVLHLDEMGSIRISKRALEIFITSNTTGI